ncbi:MAG: hypothetical protein E7274_02170 [Pseudobutyrivibrio ruminis]|uniref:hypothetical protein n=1 Tax=Pseudobutyrivibrio ruminis TaxID=46206 RepID=UPI0026EB04A1|nr:hypothetical protein [Pseudobutyrivibrio ruminis]MBE5912848.1 hypothetical protein [Pseudobutyrivibrio ruminis]
MKSKKINILFILCAAVSLIAVTIFIFTYGQAYVHSDTAIANRYGWSMVENKNLFPRTWNFVNSEIYAFRVTSLAAFITPFFHNQIFARMLATFIFMLIVLAGIAFCSRKMFKSNFFFIAAPLFILFLTGTESRNMILTEGTYMSEMLGITLGATLMYRIYESINRKLAIKETIAYAIVIFIMTLGGSRYFAEQVLPMICACAGILFFDWILRHELSFKEALKRLAITCAIIVAPSIAGYVTYKWICSWHLMNSGRTDSLHFVGFDLLPTLIQSALITIYRCFGYTGGVSMLGLTNARNIVSIVTCTLICFVIPVLQLIKMPHESKAVKFFSLFGLAHNVALMSVVILFGKCQERYCLSTIYVCIIISSRYIWTYWIENKSKLTAIVAACFVIAVIIESAFILRLTVGYKDIIASHQRVVAELENHDIHKGYGTYWTSYMFEAYSNGDIKFGEIDAHGIKLDAWMWNNDRDRYKDDHCKTALIFTADENEAAQELLTGYLPQAYDSFIIPEVYDFDGFSFTYELTNLVVYCYDFDLAKKINDGIVDGRLSAKDTFNNGLVMADDEKDEFTFYPGGLIKGPYSIAEKGEYTITIEGENISTMQASFTSEENAHDIVSKNVSTDADKQVWHLKLNNTVEDFCIVLENPDQPEARVQHISIEKK